MSTHDAVVYQAVNVARLWRARCEYCSWTGNWTSDVQQSHDAADAHDKEER